MGGKIIDFKNVHYPKAVILHAVVFYVCYAASYRDLEEILAERGVEVDHATLKPPAENLNHGIPRMF